MSVLGKNTQNDNKDIELSFSQKQRLSFIDFCLLFKGAISRKDLTLKFEMGLANATRDLSLYKELVPQNIEFNSKDRIYYQSSSFKPLFEYNSKQTLAKLAHNISDGFEGVMEIAIPVESPLQLNVPDIFIIAKLIQAIINKKAISINYTSLSSGSKSREIIPHTIIDNGLRWHVRAFDRKTKSFRDFVITRISKANLSSDNIDEHEKELEDNQWMRKMELEIIPHPNNVKYQKAIELDYGMEKGALQVTIRAALVGYLLRRWNVDCTNTGSLIGGEYHLWLKNRQALYGAENLIIAPGYIN